MVEPHKQRFRQVGEPGDREARRQCWRGMVTHPRRPPGVQGGARHACNSLSSKTSITAALTTRSFSASSAGTLSEGSGGVAAAAVAATALPTG